MEVEVVLSKLKRINRFQSYIVKTIVENNNAELAHLQLWSWSWNLRLRKYKINIINQFKKKMLTDFFEWINAYEGLGYTKKGITFYVNEFCKIKDK